MRTHVIVKGTKYRVVKAFMTLEEADDHDERSICDGCAFAGNNDCRRMFRARDTLKCVDGDSDAHSADERTDYILIPNTSEALAEYVAKRLT